jgi:hypothetical protein
MSETAVTSFVIRFKQEQASTQTARSWHGSIRHVQTNRETHFTDIQEALAFMAQFVKIDEHAADSQPDNPNNP